MDIWNFLDKIWNLYHSAILPKKEEGNTLSTNFVENKTNNARHKTAYLLNISLSE